MLINILTNILFFLGLSHIGKLFVNYLNIHKNLNKVCYLELIYPLISFILLSLIAYIIALSNILTLEIFYSILFLIILSSFFYIKNFFLERKFIYLFKNKNFFIFFVVLYLISLAPITDADTLAYHLEIGKKIILNKKLIYNTYNFHEILTGPFEVFYTIPLLIKNYQFALFQNFIAILGIFSILLKSLNKKKLHKNNFFLIILIIACPIFLKILTTGKPQLIIYSVILLIFAVFFHHKNKQKITLNFLFFINLMFVTSIFVKLNFIIPFSVIILFFIYKNNFFFNTKFLINIIFFLFLYSLLIFLKSKNLNSNFYVLFFNFFPIDLPGIKSFIFHLKIAQKELSDFFPLTMFVPLSKDDIISFFGLSFLLLIQNWKKNDLKIFCIPFIIFLLNYLIGARLNRFFLDFFLILVFLIFNLSSTNELKKNFSKMKFFYFFQIFFSLFLILYIIINLTIPSFTKNGKEYVVNQNTFDYGIYNFTNYNFKNVVIITRSRSQFYSFNETINPEFEKYAIKDDFKKFLLQIKNKKPQLLITFTQNDTLINCTNQKLHEGKVFFKTRNPFINNKGSYPFYVFAFNYNNLPNCYRY